MKVMLNIKKRYAYGIIGLLVLCFGFLVVNAYVLVPGETPNPGHPISQVGPPADCLDGQVLQFIGGEWGCVEMSSGRWYVPSDLKATSSTHNGNFGGYNGMYNWIQTHGCSGYHVCDSIEVTRYAQLYGNSAIPSGWVNNAYFYFVWYSTYYFADCDSWAGSNYGVIWDSSTDKFKGAVNSESHNVLCCK